MSKRRGGLKEYSGIVWEDRELYIMFTLEAVNMKEANALAKARFGEERLITVVKKEPPIVIEGVTTWEPQAPGECDPFREYCVKVWPDGEPVIQFTVMARNLDEAKDLAKAEYGELPMSIWNEEDRHRLR